MALLWRWMERPVTDPLIVVLSAAVAVAAGVSGPDFQCSPETVEVDGYLEVGVHFALKT